MIPAFFKAVREQCSTQTWSKGVELARRDAVTGDSLNDEEILLRVTNLQNGISPQVTLWPQDEDWTCDCGQHENPCEHVAAAVIALKRAQEQGKELPKSKLASARVTYHFKRREGALAFIRMVTSDQESQEMVLPLTTVTSGRSAGPAVTATQEDMQIELSLGNERDGVFVVKKLQRLLEQLRFSEHVFLDGTPMKVSSDVVKRELLIQDDGPHIRLKLRWPSTVKEVFRNGAVLLHDNVLGNCDSTALTPREERWLKDGEVFGHKDFNVLASEMLPALENRFDIHIETKRLPQSFHLMPRLEFYTQKAGHELEAIPMIVYGDPTIATVEGDRLVPLGETIPARQWDAEDRLKLQLYQDWQWNFGQPRRFTALDAQSFMERARLKNIPVMGPGRRAFAVRQTLVPQAQLMNGALHIQFVNTQNGEQITVSAERAQDWDMRLARGESLLPLDLGMARISEKWWQEFSPVLQELLAARDSETQLPKQFWPQLAEWQERQGLDLGESLQQAITLLQRPATDQDHTLPRDFQATLRPYQRDGVQWLMNLRALGLGALLADDMGLGKTVQTIAAIDGPALVIAPRSVIYNWQKELQRFRPNLKVHMYAGTQRQLPADLKDTVVITTFGILRLDAPKLAGVTWDSMVIDEAQNIKNPGSQTTQAVLSLHAKFRVALSGTPIENSVADLWSQMQFLNPGLLGTFVDYQRRYQSAGIEDLEVLRRKVKPFILRRSKTMVAKDLPPRIEKTLRVELDDQERGLYQTILQATRTQITSSADTSLNVMQILEVLLRLRQAACHRGLLDPQAPMMSSKTTVLLDQLQVAIAEGHRCLVFSQWTSYLDKIGAALEHHRIPYLRLDGSTTNRQEVVELFQNTDTHPVLLMSLKAGGVGVTLTAADHVFLMDPWWNPAVEAQAADRAHRIGQDKTVMIYRLVAAETIEEKIMQLKELKKDLAENLLAGQEQSQINRRELLDILLTD